VVVTVTDRQLEFARNVHAELRALGVRVELDERNEKLGFKIREAQMQKIPYMLVVGDQEVEAGGVRPRRRDGKSLDVMTPREFAELLERECREATGGRVGLGMI
jgi:threonyl-tRNA synthetase